MSSEHYYTLLSSEIARLRELNIDSEEDIQLLTRAFENNYYHGDDAVTPAMVKEYEETVNKAIVANDSDRLEILLLLIDSARLFNMEKFVVTACKHATVHSFIAVYKVAINHDSFCDRPGNLNYSLLVRLANKNKDRKVLELILELSLVSCETGIPKYLLPTIPADTYETSSGPGIDKYLYLELPVNTTKNISR